MIASFRSKALRRFWNSGDAKGIKPEWTGKIRRQLDALNAAQMPEDLDVPGFGWHGLKANLAGRYALTVSRNWRLTFGWSGHDATEVDLEGYHG